MFSGYYELININENMYFFIMKLNIVPGLLTDNSASLLYIVLHIVRSPKQQLVFTIRRHIQ